jgi:hypothetical protein
MARIVKADTKATDVGLANDIIRLSGCFSAGSPKAAISCFQDEIRTKRQFEQGVAPPECPARTRKGTGATKSENKLERRSSIIR